MSDVPEQKITVPSMMIEQVHFPRILNTLGVIPTSYKESMDYYETLAWLCKYLEETVVPAVNQNGQAVKELQGLYVELKNYVDNFFSSEDFRQTVYDTLHTMATDGTLETMLSTIVDERIADFQETFDETIGEVNENMEHLTETVNGFNDRITATENSITTLNNTTIPGIQDDIGDVETSVDTINDTTIPGIQSDIASQNYVNLKRFSPKEGTLKPIAHRGASAEAPENTSWSFIIAGRHGFWGCETDIRECATGEFVCLHDDTVDRMTNGTGSISQLNYSYISGLTIDAGNKVDSYPAEKIPTLYRFLEICNEYNMVAIIEIKQVTNLENMYNIVKKYGMLNKTIFMSFDNSYLTGLKEIDPNVQCMLLGNMTEANMNLCVQNKYLGISVPYDDLSEILLQQAHDLGLEVNTYVVNVNANNQSLVYILCDYTTTDSMDFYSTSNSRVIKTVNGIELHNKRDLLYAEGGQFTGGILGGLIKRANSPGITTGTSLKNAFYPVTTNRAISTMILPLKTGGQIEYVCDSSSKFAIETFDKNGQYLGDIGWIVEGSGSGTYTESRSNASFGILEFANIDNSTICDFDLERFAKIVKSVS